MINLETLKTVFGVGGEDLHDYLMHKNRGGKSNAKGNTFENFYTVYQIAKAFNEVAIATDTFFSSQLFVFVDDLLVEQVRKKMSFIFKLKTLQH